MVANLFFADDSIIFCRATAEEGRELVRVIEVYGKLSGQVVNLDKSNVVFSRNTPMGVRGQIEAVMGIKHTNQLGKYLGLNVEFGMSKRAAFGAIKDRVADRIKGWAEQYLSQAGKEVLLKSIALAMPIYTMNCFKLPVSVCKEINSMLANFLWQKDGSRKGVHWGRWDDLSRHKSCGGLGFKDIHSFNLALLAKQGWRILTRPESLLARIYTAKYLRRGPFLEVVVKRNASWGWRSIMAGRDVLKRGCRWRVGLNSKVQIWRDPWLPRASTFRPLGCLDNSWSVVKDLIDAQGERWNMSSLRQCFVPEDVNLIRTIPLSRRCSKDKLVWHHTDFGVYSVRSGYRSAMEIFNGNGSTSDSGRGEIWGDIWRLPCPPKIQNFIWRACRNFLAVNSNLKRRCVKEDERCGICDQKEETVNHALLECEAVRAFWFGSQIQLDSRRYQPELFVISWERIR